MALQKTTRIAAEESTRLLEDTSIETRLADEESVTQFHRDNLDIHFDISLLDGYIEDSEKNDLTSIGPVTITGGTDAVIGSGTQIELLEIYSRIEI